MTEEGCIVETANDGVACVDMIEKADADYYKMILMDIQMPVMNGLDVAAIRNLDRKDAEFVPIIAMSANAFQDDVERSKRLNFTPEERAARAEHKAEVLGTKLEKASYLRGRWCRPEQKLPLVAMRLVSV